MCQYLINDLETFNKWQNSKAFADIYNFIKDCAINLSNDELCYKNYIKVGNLENFVSEHFHLNWIFGSLCLLSNLICLIKPHKTQQRFGNKAFALYIQKAKETIIICNNNLYNDESVEQNTSHFNNITDESVAKDAIIFSSKYLGPYLISSLGNPERLDYGTGHELMFIICLYLACRFDNLLNNLDKIAHYLIYGIFEQYTILTTKLQEFYNLEPAGSKGVWGLDDYKFLCFLFGAHELIHVVDVPNYCYKDICFDNINTYYMHYSISKLYNIGEATLNMRYYLLKSLFELRDWEKISAGLLKMYKAEVLCTYNIVQHLVFTEYFTLSN